MNWVYIVVDVSMGGFQTPLAAFREMEDAEEYMDQMPGECRHYKLPFVGGEGE